MGLFSRQKSEEDQHKDSDIDEDINVTVPSGPSDSEGKMCPDGYLDLGALYVPAIPGMQLRAQFEGDKKTLRRILLISGTSGIQVSVAAAPRSGGMWEELREQVAQSIRQMNGSVTEVETKYGIELDANIPVRLPDGGEGKQPMRIIGIEGPRWLLRIDLQGGAAAGDEAQRAQCEEIIDRFIVNRGSEPRVRLELLPLALPRSGDNETV
ncbi:DUF3710 domain-containing protein [Actinomycetaceae bacterium WB03_NA08]|uniref:DUF3710 domain-containing protein n=1 Tax=Scrofimicrobium canadense TaxID=2652290 RepID=A0A6N7W608_9ACTO|nr:DUF3710 domain-containing protein [Scrofimicrobium canadense]MSS84831.1 DUF3710 domain-containing protein [Scrofimicrobium canadense]